MAPIIGIPVVDELAQYKFTNYVKAIEAHGGGVRFLIRDTQPAELFVANIDGLLIPGGGDIHPKYFGESWHPTLKYVNEARDESEIQLSQQALEADLPILGICYGIQIMGIAMGGNLYQDIDDEYPKEALYHTEINGVDSQHDIEIEFDSLLSQITGERIAKVNSAHHQAVKDIGEGFVVTARSEDGIIEAMENPSKQFVLGVQYHPERMTKTPEFREHRRKLFEAFINAASH
jgi:putative glutamine amidotransferase